MYFSKLRSRESSFFIAIEAENAYTCIRTYVSKLLKLSVHFSKPLRLSEDISVRPKY